MSNATPQVRQQGHFSWWDGGGGDFSREDTAGGRGHREQLAAAKDHRGGPQVSGIWLALGQLRLTQGARRDMVHVCFVHGTHFGAKDLDLATKADVI